MNSKAALLASVVVVVGCTRTTEAPQPKAMRDPVLDAAAEASVQDGGAKTTAATPASPFTIVARAPMQAPLGDESAIAMPIPLVQRLPGGGLAVASAYARARATGGGALVVELLGRGLETEVFYRGFVQGIQGWRWVWADEALTVVVDEEETSRSGPRISSYKLGPNGYKVLSGSTGYWSAVSRDGNVLALERATYEVPNSSAYPKGSEFYQNTWSVKPARVAVLSGKGPAPVIPAGVCPSAMSAAPDGAVLVAVSKCDAAADKLVIGALRYAPGATQAKVEWFAARSIAGANAPELVPFAASANEMYIASGKVLQTWDGKAWADSEPFASNEAIASISRGPDRTLWAVVKGERLVKRAPDATTWTTVPLPLAPADALDEQAYSASTWGMADFHRVDALPEDQELRPQSSGPMSPLKVDATAEEILVLAHKGNEAFVVSTHARTPVARLPSVPTQRARLAQTFKRKVAATPKDCSKSFLTFPEGTAIEAIRAGLGGPTDAGESAKLADGIVEGEKRLIVYGDQEPLMAAMKRLSSLTPKRLCDPAVVERDL